jgi:hypothetical protein
MRRLGPVAIQSHHIYLTDRMRHGPRLRILCLLSSLNPWGLRYGAPRGFPPRAVSSGSQGLFFCLFSVSGILLIFLKTLTLDEINASFSQPQCECEVVSDIRMSVERRRHKRFSVSKGAYVALRPSDYGVGVLIDISMGGLTFDYVTLQPSSVKATELDIFLTDSTFRLLQIPCQSVWDLTIYDFPTSPIQKRRCGVEFRDLTSHQRLQIEHFIKNHTADECESDNEIHVRLSKN